MPKNSLLNKPEVQVALPISCSLLTHKGHKVFLLVLRVFVIGIVIINRSINLHHSR